MCIYTYIIYVYLYIYIGRGKYQLTLLDIGREAWRWDVAGGVGAALLAKGADTLLPLLCSFSSL